MNTIKKFRTLLVNLSVLLALALSLVSTAPAAAAAGPLSADEIAGLQFMREEEKLARDVYLTLSQKWGLPIFNNIANSEATHMAAVKTLLDRYGIADPVAGKAVGVFADPTLQVLYNQLIAQGSQSLSAALKVGGAIEEIDIRDLKEYSASTTQVDIKTVYNNLLNGSYNHLRSFINTLKTQTGEVYQPQYLDLVTDQGVISSSLGWRGRSGGGWR
ncbi:hypothetical protein TFLX_05932 [Thermoflexales bacterium]|nr:hypothetical protein TFLX_05932 [Thermoflexales bacterium]